MKIPFTKREERAFPTLSLSEFIDLTQFSFGGSNFQLMPSQTMPTGERETVDPGFAGYIRGIYKRNGPIFACMMVRQALFSQIRFQFSRMEGGRRAALFGTEALQPLEVPWPGGTTGDLLAKMLQHVDLSGNAFALRQPDRLRLLRPDYVDIVLAEDSRATGSDIIGYAYWPDGRNRGRDPVPLQTEEVAHFAPIPDPEAAYRGMSWLTPIVREVMGDNAATTHKLKFFEAGATPNMIVKVPEGVRREAFEAMVTAFKSKHEGLDNAYKTLFLTQGSDATVVGSQFKEMDFKVTQGGGETRIASAAGVPPVIVGFSEGLQGSALNAGNYAMSMRRFIDITMVSLWANVSASLAPIIDVPSGAELWFDDREVAALHENAADQANIEQTKAQTIHQLITAGFNPDDVIAVINPEWAQLEHSGLFSVQLQPAGSVGEGKGSLLGGTPVPIPENAPNGGSANP